MLEDLVSVMGNRVHLTRNHLAIFSTSQNSTTGVTNAVVRTGLPVG